MEERGKTLPEARPDYEASPDPEPQCEFGVFHGSNLAA